MSRLQQGNMPRQQSLQPTVQPKGVNQSSSQTKSAIKVCMVGAPSSGKSCLVSRLQYNEFKEDLVTVGVSFVPYTIAISKHTLAKSQYSSYFTRFFHNPDHKPLYPVVPQPKQMQKSVSNSTSVTIVPDPTDPEIKHVTINCWDTAGADRYAILTRKYYQGAHACIVCYDLTDPESWEKLKHWVEQVQDAEPDALIVIVGNKKDLITPLPQATINKYRNTGLTFNSVPFPRATPIEQVREYALSIGAVVFESSSKLNEDLNSCDYVFEIFNFIAHEIAYRQSKSPDKEKTNPNRVQLNQKPDKEPTGCC